jgi:polyketide biosynthesis enoyl-CoA hydratase PksI
VPVIAAMQGHALGGGLAFGLFADMVVLSRESLYGANFMKYGFTPGMGATYIIPERFGAALGQEMLLTANLYHGGELARRGVGYPVEPRAQVIPAAMKLARDLADKPPLSLRLLKKHLTRATAAVLPEIVRLEQEMHDRSFAQPGVRDRILTRFGDS